MKNVIQYITNYNNYNNLFKTIRSHFFENERNRAMKRVFCLLATFLAFFLLSAVSFADSIVFPNNMITLDEEAFCQDISIQEVILPDGLETIGARAFMNSGLKKAYIPDSVTIIGEDAFLGTDVTIVSSIEGYAHSYAIENSLNWQASFIPLVSKYFPDELFCNYLSDTFDTDKNGILSTDEINSITEIKIPTTGQESSNNIVSLEGIRYFPFLKILTCNSHDIEELNLSGLVSLERLNCLYNESLRSLNLSGCSSLWLVHIQHNSITNLNLSGCYNIIELTCCGNQLSSLDLSDCPILQSLDCSENNLTQLDVSNYSELRSLYCHKNRLNSLNVSGCGKLETLWCGNNYLRDLNVNGLTKLYRLHCQNNYIKTLDLRSCPISDLVCDTSVKVFYRQ